MQSLVSVEVWIAVSYTHLDVYKRQADEVHKQGAKFMVWFEPERVMKNSDWANQYPQWMLDAKGSVKQEEWQKDGDHDAVLFNMGKMCIRDSFCSS